MRCHIRASSQPSRHHFAPRSRFQRERHRHSLAHANRHTFVHQRRISIQRHRHLIRAHRQRRRKKSPIRPRLQLAHCPRRRVAHRHRRPRHRGSLRVPDRPADRAADNLRQHCRRTHQQYCNEDEECLKTASHTASKKWVFRDAENLGKSLPCSKSGRYR